MTITSAPRARVGATGRAVVLSPLGSRLALKRAPKGAGGFGARAPAHRVGHVADASRGAVPGVRSSWAWATATGRTSGSPTLGVHLVLVARTCLGRGVDYVTMRTPRRTVWGTVVPHEDGNGPRRNPHGRGRWLQAVRAARTRPACTPCS